VEFYDGNDPVKITDFILRNLNDILRELGNWLFIGRLLYIDDPGDAVILADDRKHLSEFDMVYGALLPYWCHVMSAVHKNGGTLSAIPECPFASKSLVCH